MAERTVIVFEQRPRWTPELQRQFLAEEVRVRGCRAIADIAPLLLDVSQAVVLLELEASPAGCLQFLGERVGRFRFVPVVVVASARASDLEWPVRELGALEFLTEPITGEHLAALCRRQWTT